MVRGYPRSVHATLPPRTLVSATLAALALLYAGCMMPVPPPRLTDKPKPGGDGSMVANFKALFELPLHSRPVLPTIKVPGLMDRLLLSPNLVFESSRSSLEEPDTVGPKNATHGSPNLTNALGEAVDIRLSTILMNYLSEKRSSLLAPVVTRRWSPDWQCRAKDCPQTSWVERLILMHQNSPRPADPQEKNGPPAEKPAAAAPPPVAPAPAALPTAAFAVRRLGIASRRINVAAQLDASGQVLSFIPTADRRTSSMCAPTTLVVPVVAFMAELVNLQDGRIIARIDEERIPRTTLDPRRQFTSFTWEPVKTTAYETRANRSVPYEYISDWRQTDTRCAQALRVYEDVRRSFLVELQSRLPEAVAEILKTTLDPLY